MCALQTRVFCTLRIIINNQETKMKLAVMINEHILVILPIGKPRQMGCCEFGVNLGYRARTSIPLPPQKRK